MGLLAGAVLAQEFQIGSDEAVAQVFQVSALDIFHVAVGELAQVSQVLYGKELVVALV